MPGIAQHFGVRQWLAGLGGGTSTCNAGNDREHISRSDRRCRRGEMPDVSFIEIQTHEVAKAAIVLEQMPAQASVGGQQTVQHLAHRVSSKVYGILARGKTAEWRGNRDSHGHMGHTSLRTCRASWCMAAQSSSRTQLVMSLARP